jgi:hypothetical protein
MSESNRVTSMTAATNFVASATPDYLVELHVKNVTAGAKFLQIHNAASLPSNGAVPEFVWDLAASATKELKFRIPEYFDTGIVVASSSTAATLTVSVTSDLIGTAIIHGED